MVSDLRLTKVLGLSGVLFCAHKSDATHSGPYYRFPTTSLRTINHPPAQQHTDHKQTTADIYRRCIYRLCRNSTALACNKKPRYKSRTAQLFSAVSKAIKGSYTFSVSRDFSVRVFCSTPKIQRVFARGLSFGRKFAKHERFA